MLVVDPKQRLDADEILAHPWIKGDDTPRTDMPDVRVAIKKYNASRKLKKGILMVMAANRFKKVLQLKKAKEQGL